MPCCITTFAPKQLFDRIIEKTVETFKEAILAALGNPNMLFVDRLKDGIASQFDIMVANPLLPRFFLNAMSQSRAIRPVI